jgi:hypothetical protein
MARRLLKKAVQQGRRRVETGGAPSVGYVEDFDEPRTMLADFFSRLPVYTASALSKSNSPFMFGWIEHLNS